MEGSSISILQKGKSNTDPSDLYETVEEYTVTEVSLDDNIQHEELEEFQETENGDLDAGDEEEGISMQYEIEDHQYISQADGFHKLKEVKGNNTQYIICSPDEPLDTYKASWTRGMTQILIEEYRNMVDDFRNPHKKQKDLWYELANNMCRRGCDVSWDMCDRKWRNLKHTFKTIYYNHHRTSKSKRRWEFYNDLEELFVPQGSDEGLRKSRTISPPPSAGEDQDSMPSATSSLGFTTRSSKLPRVTTPVAPQVSYTQVLDVSNLQNQIVSYPQIVLCDENGIPINKKTSVPSSSVPSSKQKSDDCEVTADTPPTWFTEFMKQYRIDEERRLSVLKEMHAEVIQVEKRKCAALENLLKRLVQ